MAIKITRALEVNDIREGFGTVKGKQLRGEKFWVIPGGTKIKSKEEAKKYAKRMDALIRENMKRTGNSLI